MSTINRFSVVLSITLTELKSLNFDHNLRSLFFKEDDTNNFEYRWSKKSSFLEHGKHF